MDTRFFVDISELEKIKKWKIQYVANGFSAEGIEIPPQQVMLEIA